MWRLRCSAARLSRTTTVTWKSETCGRSREPDSRVQPGGGDVVCGDDLTSSGQRHRPCPTFDFFNEEAIGGLVQGDAASDSFRASAGSCASANRSNRTSAAAISRLSALSHPACRRHWRRLWSCCVRRERLPVQRHRPLPTVSLSNVEAIGGSRRLHGLSPGTTHVNLFFPCRTAWRRQKHGI